MASFKILAVLFLAVYVKAQNCGFTGITETTIMVDPVLETTPENATIWEHDTFNVTGAAAVSSPHTKYLRGLRYPSRYVYEATNLFKDFVQVERSNELRRDIVITCADTTTVPYTFIIPIIDENTEQPYFVEKSYSAEVSLSDTSTEPSTANIVVSDGDYEYDHARLIVRSSNVFVTPFVDPMWSGEHPDSYIYKVDFFVSKDLAVGQYDVILTADDGRHSDYTVLTINVVA